MLCPHTFWMDNRGGRRGGDSQRVEAGVWVKAALVLEWLMLVPWGLHKLSSQMCIPRGSNVLNFVGWLQKIFVVCAHLPMQQWHSFHQEVGTDFSPHECGWLVTVVEVLIPKLGQKGDRLAPWDTTGMLVLGTWGPGHVESPCVGTGDDSPSWHPNQQQHWSPDLGVRKPSDGSSLNHHWL